MRACPDTFEDLVDTAGVSRGRLDDAMRRALQDVLEWCDRPDAPFTRTELRDAVIQALPLALRVGIPERLMALDARDEFEADRISISTQPEIDLLADGVVRHTLHLWANAEFKRTRASKVATRNSRAVDLGVPTTWHCIVQLGLGSDPRSDAARFYDAEGAVTLREKYTR